jgi:hypothetical protein
MAARRRIANHPNCFQKMTDSGGIFGVGFGVLRRTTRLPFLGGSLITELPFGGSVMTPGVCFWGEGRRKVWSPDRRAGRRGLQWQA